MKKKGWASVTPDDFEELIFWVLQREGFFNVSWHGKSGGDKGRDVTCQRSEVLGSRVVIYDCVVQCKKYAGRVARRLLYEDILKASEHNPDYFILATTGIVGSSTKDWLTSQEHSFRFKLVLWERMDIEILLERHQDLRARFLGIPVETDVLLKQVANETHTLADLDKVLLKPAVRRAVTAAYDMALKYSSMVTVGHLLIALLRADRSCTRPIFMKQGIDPKKLADVLEEMFVKQQPGADTIHLGLQLSASVRLAFETALGVMRSVREGALSERALAWGILVQPHSGTMEFIERDCRVNRNQLLEELGKKHFSKKERDSLAAQARSRPYSSTKRRVGCDTIWMSLGPGRS